MAQANLTHFMQGLARRGVAVSDYSALYAWSLAEPAAFWSELAGFAQVRAEWGAGPVLTDAGQMPGARFFPGAQLNFAENLLRHRDEQPALIFRNERGQRSELSFNALYARRRARGVIGSKAREVGPGIASPRYCRTSPKPALRCWRPRRGARSGLPALPTSRRVPCSSASGRSPRRCCSAPTATPTRARGSRACRRLPSLARNCRASSASPWSATSIRWHRSRASRTPNASRNSGRPLRTSLSSASTSMTRCTFSTPPAPPAPRSASCTGSAARCCSTRKSTCCTPTSSATTGCSTTRPAAG